MLKLILAGGSNRSGDTPLWLAEVGGQVFVEYVIESLRCIDGNTVLVVESSVVEKWHLDHLSTRLEGVQLTALPNPTQGAPLSALYALTSQPVDHSGEVLLVAADELITVDFNTIVDGFRISDADLGVVSFRSINPRYSYLQEWNGRIVGSTEKDPVTNQALTSFYWFRSSQVMHDIISEYILSQERVDERYFLSGCINYALLLGMKVESVAIDADHFTPLKSNNDVSTAVKRIGI